MANLEVKQDGIIYIHPDNIRVEDQRAANLILWRVAGDLHSFPKPGIYPIPDLKYSTFEKEFGTGMKKFAILKTSNDFKSTDSVGERPSEDTLWAEIISSARSYDGTPKDLISLTEYYKRFYSVTRNK